MLDHPKLGLQMKNTIDPLNKTGSLIGVYTVRTILSRCSDLVVLKIVSILRYLMAV
jgi:hypothetical protein